MVEINLKELFKADIDGKELSIADMGEIAHYYQACCVGEYLGENYKISSVEAIDLGYEVKRLQDKYGFNEETAIYAVVRKYALEER